MSLTLSTADSALKEDYQPAIREQLNNDNMLLNQVERTSEDVEGRRAVLSLHVARSAGVGARAEGGTLPEAGNQGYVEERVPLYYNYGRIKVSGPVIKAMKSDKGSFTRAVDSETKGITNDLKRDVNRQLYGTADGKIATCGTTSASTTVTLATTTTLTQMRQFEVGMRVDIGTIANPTSVVANQVISAVSRANKTFTIPTAVTTAGTDFVFRQGNGGGPTTTGAGQKELTGLRVIVSASGTLFNVNPSTYPVWASYANTTGGSPTDLMFETVLDEVAIESGTDPNLMIGSAGALRAYSASLTAQKRFVNTMDLKGGFKALSVASGSSEVAFIKDKDCPLGFVFLLNTAHLKLHQMSDWEWMDDDGAVLSRVSGEDAYEATLYRYAELTTDQRNAHGYISSVTEA